jgi:hypothetical protein
MAKLASTILGIVFILVGLVGFAMPNFAGAHLTPAHNIIHLVSGAAALYFGLAATPAAARLFALLFGAFYLLLGVVGFYFGVGGWTSLPPNMQQGVNDHMIMIIPGVLEFGTMDHVIHLLLGFIFLITGAVSREKVRPLIEGEQH